LTNVELPWGNELVSTGLQFVVGLVQRVPHATATLFAVSIFSVRYTRLVASARDYDTDRGTNQEVSGRIKKETFL
jgi:hypothetical protein